MLALIVKITDSRNNQAENCAYSCPCNSNVRVLSIGQWTRRRTIQKKRKNGCWKQLVGNEREIDELDWAFEAGKWSKVNFVSRQIIPKIVICSAKKLDLTAIAKVLKIILVWSYHPPPNRFSDTHTPNRMHSKVSVTRKPCNRREKWERRDASVFRCIEFYNGIVRFPCHSTAFLMVFVCRVQIMLAFSLVSEEVAAEISKNVVDKPTVKWMNEMSFDASSPRNPAISAHTLYF